MFIRPENKQDLDTVYSLIQTAFSTAYVKDGTEQDFAVGLRNGSGCIPELALVMEQDDKIIGHIMLTKMFIKQDNGDKFESLLLAPVAVLQEYRNQGLGSVLINEASKRAADMGYKAVFLVGDPAYYERLGFKSTVTFGIQNENGIPDKFVMAIELIPDALRSVSGKIDIS